MSAAAACQVTLLLKGAYERRHRLHPREDEEQQLDTVLEKVAERLYEEAYMVCAGGGGD